MKKKQLMVKMVELIDSMNSLQQRLKDVMLENEELKVKIAILQEKVNSAPVIPQNEIANTDILAETAPNSTAEESYEEPLFFEEENETLKTQTEVSEASENIFSETKPEKIQVNEVKLQNEALEYGSITIGKIVVESIKYANLIGESNNENKKELLNLIMGKSEVVKSEIFTITEGDLSLDMKKELTDAQYAEAVDYFKSAYGQIIE